MEWKNDNGTAVLPTEPSREPSCILILEELLVFGILVAARKLSSEIQERAEFYPEGYVSGTYFKGKVNLSGPLLAMVWAEGSFEECMLTTEKDQESVIFLK